MSKRTTFEKAKRLILEKIQNINNTYDLKLSFLRVKGDWIGNQSRIIIYCNKHEREIEVTYLNFVRNEKYCCPMCAIEIQHDNQRRSTEEFIRLSKQKYGDRFSYEKTVYITARKKVIITCKRHGDFLVVPEYHLRESNNFGGCKECVRESRKPQPRLADQFIEKARKVHGDKYDYSKVIYINNRTPVIIICPIHGEFTQLPVTHLRGSGCHRCSSSIGENIIHNYLSERKIEFEYHKVIRDGENWLIPDFLFKKEGITYMIEYNGIQHYKEDNYFNRKNGGFDYQKKRDELKIKYCNENNIILIIVPYTLNKKDIIEEYLDEVLFNNT